MGSNKYGKLATNKLEKRGGVKKSSSNPCLVEGLLKFQAKQVSCGRDHTAVLTRDGEMFTWGGGA